VIRVPSGGDGIITFRGVGAVAGGCRRQELLATVDGVVRAAQAEGALRGDVGTGDVVALLSLLLTPMSPARREWLASDRALALMLDGLRAQPGTGQPRTALPGQPLGLDDVDTG
jgi:hypothetical protein